MKPYKDNHIEKNKFIRKFDPSTNSNEYKWHRDLKDRKITILEGSGWKFQYDNQLPIDLIKGNELFISRNSWHRLIKGNNPLIIKIEEK
jgi:quercetin dioxygenase-like cupin family protein